jgi:ABC-type amino acid transport substrate-binding protein
MALPTDSPLREPLDRTLAKIINSDEWIELKNRYMGGNH